MTMSQVSRGELEDYFKQHRIADLLRDLTEELAYSRPQAPLGVMRDKLSALLEQQGGPATNGADAADQSAEQPGGARKGDHGFSMRMYVEVRAPGGKEVRHFSKRGLQVADHQLLSWQDEAISQLTEACGAFFKGGSASVLSAVLAVNGEWEAKCAELEKQLAEAVNGTEKIDALQGQLDEALRANSKLEDELKRLGGVRSDKGPAEQRKTLPQVEKSGLSPMRGGHVGADLTRIEVKGMQLPAAFSERRFKKARVSRPETPNRDQERKDVECAMRIIFMNDVCDLHNLTRFDSVVREHRTANTLVAIPGDFLGGNVASILDKGSSVVEMLNRIGVDYVCFGSTEADIPHDHLVRRTREFKGKWLNSNMPSWSEPLPEYDIIEVGTPGGATRKVGLLGLVWGGAGSWHERAQSVTGTVSRLKKMLIEEHGCDIVIPLTNQRMHEDLALADAVPGLPLIVGGHGRNPQLKEAYSADSEGNRSMTTIVKTGVSHDLAAVIDLEWPAGQAAMTPRVRVEQVRLDDYFANESLEALAQQSAHNARAVDAVQLVAVPGELLPLSSSGVRRRQTTVGTLICNLCKQALACDAAALAGSVMRRDSDYEPGKTSFSFYDLKKEIKFETELTVVPLRGDVLQAVVAASRAASRLDPPQEWGGYYQLDGGMKWDDDVGVLTHVGGEAVDKERVYTVCLLFDSVMGVFRNQPLINWANDHFKQFPLEKTRETVRRCKDTILIYAMAHNMSNDVISTMMKNGLDGAEFVQREEVAMLLAKSMGSASDGAAVPEFLIDNVMGVIDTNNDGRVSRDEFAQFLRVFDKMEHFKSQASMCSLRIISINDVYEITNFPMLYNLIQDYKVENTIVVLPGDFVAPSLLSSLDKGRGMIDMMNRVGVDYVCFGNHENDIPLDELRLRITEFKGKWINSNMPDWRPALPEYAVFDITSGGQSKKIGLLGLNTIDKNLYQEGAFGGAMETALPVIETARALRKKLVEELGCDLVIPMTHQVMPEDRQFAQAQMGFPLIIGAHDHDPYLEEVAGATIVKTGADATMAAVIDITWPDAPEATGQVKVKVDLIETKRYPAHPEISAAVKKHLRAVEELEGAYLLPVDPAKRLYSTKMRREPTPIGTLLTSLVRDGIRSADGSSAACDGVIMDAGALRRNLEYPEGYSVFTYGDLKKEIPFPSEVVVSL